MIGENNVAYITGGSKGIGLAVAEKMLENNMRVAVTGRSMASLEKGTQALVKKYPGRLLLLEADVRDRAAQAAAIEQIISAWGRLDVLIANAGVGHFASIEDMSVDAWKQVIDVNLTGVFHSCQLCIPHLKASKGYIITIASLAGTNFFANGTAYNASKFGLVGFTQAMMLDLRKYDIKVSTIMPGSVATYFNGHVPNDADAWKIQPEDLGEMVINLLAMNPRTLPSKIEVRPSRPPGK